MTLTPIRQSGYAEKVSSAVAKMDDDEARLFAQMVISDYLEETIEKNLPMLQTHLDKVVSKRVELVQKALLTAVSKKNDAEAVAYAEALVEISKATNQYDLGAVFNEANYNRGSDGRFRAKFTSNERGKPMPKKAAESLGVRHGKGYDSLPKGQQARFQQEYIQLANFLSAVEASTGGDADVFLKFKDKNGSTFTERVQGTRAKASMLDSSKEGARLVGAEARPNTLNIGGAVFGLSSALGASPERSAALATGANRYQKAFPDFAQTWLAETDPRSSTAQTYNRIAAGSKLLGIIDHPNAQIASAVGQFVGSHGPEAEQVFGPGIRRTAYRYRGVTKAPDADLVTAFESEVMRAKMRTAERGRSLAPVQTAAARVVAERRGATDDELEGGRTVIREYLDKRLPAKGLYNLQLSSGTTPPSEGIILDKNGKIVAQAVGYGDDHYLPFNLKNLSKVRGGEYIRTRSVGGPTSEDVYTGLMTGAKQVTVVSRSGTFIVKFKEDFKGGRRYNDKALRMTKRYQQILDAVQSEQVDRQDIDPTIRAAITAQVHDQYKGLLDNKGMAGIVQEKIEDFKSTPDLNEKDYELANYMTRMMQIRVDRGEVSQHDADEFRRSVTNTLAEEKEYKFRLNGRGYNAGLNALREQFPYYLEKPIFIPKDAMELRGANPERDRGYVEPGRNRPTEAKAGLYGTPTNEGYGKFSASQANYQGRRAARRGGTPDGETKEPSLESTGEKKVDVKQRIEQNRKNAGFVSAAAELQAYAKTQNISASGAGSLEWIDYTPQDLMDPAKAKDFDEKARLFIAAAAQAGVQVPAEVKNKYLTGAGHIGQSDFAEDMVGVWPEKALNFGEKNPKRLAEIDAEYPSGIVSARRLSELSDDELKQEHAKAVEIMTAIAGIEDPSDRAFVLKDLGLNRDAPGLQRAIANPQGFMKALHEARYQNQGVEERVSPLVLSPALPDSDDGPSKGARILLENFEKAAEIFDNGENYEAADALRDAAQQIHDELPRVKSASDVDALRSTLAHEIELAQLAFRHREFKQHLKTVQVDRGNGGSILRY